MRSLAAAEPRITTAVFGLAGQDTLAVTASRLTIPIEFLPRWDDELVPREAALRRAPRITGPWVVHVRNDA
jgi:hypothetical protein